MSAVWQRPCCSNIGRMAFSNPGPAVVAAICPTKTPDNTLRTWAPCAGQHSLTKLRGFGAVEPP